jgi:hypothetical protein
MTATRYAQHDSYAPLSMTEEKTRSDAERAFSFTTLSR